MRPASTGTGLKVEPIMKSINLDNFGFVDLLLDHCSLITDKSLLVLRILAPLTSHPLPHGPHVLLVQVSLPGLVSR